MTDGMGVFLAGVAAFFGAIVGGIATVLAQFLQAHATHKQQLVASATQLATTAYEREISFCKTSKQTLNVAPLGQYVAFYTALLRALESRTLSKKDIQALEKRYDVHYPDPPVGPIRHSSHILAVASRHQGRS